jgi:hypothetical protein
MYLLLDLATTEHVQVEVIIVWVDVVVAIGDMSREQIPKEFVRRQ